MNKSFLVLVHPNEDVDFLNICEIPFIFLDRLGKSDSGWCDRDSGAVILSYNESLLFTVENAEDELILRLKFANRIRGSIPLN